MTARGRKGWALGEPSGLSAIIAVMAYDDDLARRVRALIGDEPSVTEKRMFGGLAFLLDGNMAVAVSPQGGLMVRCAPAETARLLGEPHTRPMEMQGREIDGWVRVSAEGVEGVEGDNALAPWVERGVAYARSLPPKG